MQRSCLWRRKVQESQVIGADVPSFDRFPYKAREILHLYRGFWRMVYRYPPQERHDLIFRLRNEFRSKRNLAGPKVIAAALRRGEGLLEVQKTMMDARVVRQSAVTNKQLGAQSVDVLFDQVQAVAGHMVPGLKRYRPSLPGQGERYAANGATAVHSNAKPIRIR